MENEKSPRKKAIADVSLVVLAFAIFIILIVAATIIYTKGKFTGVLTEMIAGELPIITKLFVLSISSVTYGIFFALLVLVLVLKELFLRNKTVALVVNIATGTAAIVLMPVYMVAVFLPMAGVAL
jgi:hypothetical protein